MIETREALQDLLQFILAHINMLDHPPIEHHGWGVTPVPLAL